MLKICVCHFLPSCIQFSLGRGENKKKIGAYLLIRQPRWTGQAMIGLGSDKNGSDLSSKGIGYNWRGLDVAEAGLRDINPTRICETT